MQLTNIWINRRQIILIFTIFILAIYPGCSKNSKNTQETHEFIEQRLISPGSDNSLFFVKGDTITHYNYSSGHYSQFSKYDIYLEPQDWDSFKTVIFKERNLNDSYFYANDIEDALFNAGLSLHRSIDAWVYDKAESRKITLIQLSVMHRGFNNWSVCGLAEFPAHYYSFKNNTIKLTNGYEGKVDRFSYPFNKTYANGIPIQIQKKDSIGERFGETVYDYKTIDIDTVFAIDLSNLGFLCFGSNGLLSLSDDLNMDIYSTKYPFRYILRKRGVDSTTP